MIWKAKTPFRSPKAGDYKYCKIFALWPTRVGDDIVWLEFYEEVYRYEYRKRAFAAGPPGNVRGFSFLCHGWDFQYSRLINGKFPTNSR